jgi:hypothetical protein
MTNHTGHNHPMTTAGRTWCRKLRLADRPVDLGMDESVVYTITATDAQGRSLDLNGTPEGESFHTSSVAYVVWVINNLRYGVDHDWDAETHTMRRVRTIEIGTIQKCSKTISPSGWTFSGQVEVHTINDDGTRTQTWKKVY